MGIYLHHWVNISRCPASASLNIFHGCGGWVKIFSTNLFLLHSSEQVAGQLAADLDRKKWAKSSSLSEFLCFSGPKDL